MVHPLVRYSHSSDRIIRDNMRITSRKSLYLAISITFILSGLFYFLPIDQIVVHWSYQQGFFRSAPLLTITRITRMINIIIVLITLLCLAKALYQKNKTLTRQCIFLCVCWIITSAVITPILKTTFSRTRPMYTMHYGGSNHFQKIWQIGNECKSNCSFISDEATIAFSFIAFLFLIKKSRRRHQVAAAVVCYYIFVSIIRMLIGKHFLSDVVMAGCLTFIETWIIYAAFNQFSLTKLTVSSDHDYNRNL